MKKMIKPVLLSVVAILCVYAGISHALVTPGKTDFVDYCIGPNNSKCVFQIDVNGNVTANNVTAQGAVTNSGTSITNSATTLINSLPADQNGITQSSTIIPTASYMTLESTSTGSTVVTLTSLPNVSTSSVVGGSTPWPNGTWLVLGSTCSASTKITVLTDNATLSGSQLHLGATSRQVGPHKILTLIYDAVNQFWDEVSYANNN